MAKDEAEYERERARTGRPMVWTVAFAAAINNGKIVETATTIADTALRLYDHRFTKAPAE